MFGSCRDNSKHAKSELCYLLGERFASDLLNVAFWLSRMSAMEFFLRQIAHQNNNPLDIPLLTDEVILGRTNFDALSKYLQVSRSHAQLMKREGRWYIKDLKSLNGVYVNQRLIDDVTLLELGDHIGLGVNNPESGFVCALSIRNPPIRVIKTEPVEVIDLSDDDLPIVKKDPEDAAVPYGLSINKSVCFSDKENSAAIPSCSYTVRNETGPTSEGSLASNVLTKPFSVNNPNYFSSHRTKPDPNINNSISIDLNMKLSPSTNEKSRELQAICGLNNVNTHLPKLPIDNPSSSLDVNAIKSLETNTELSKSVTGETVRFASSLSTGYQSHGGESIDSKFRVNQQHTTVDIPQYLSFTANKNQCEQFHEKQHFSVVSGSRDFTNNQQPRIPPSSRHEVVNKQNLNFTANVHQNEQFLGTQDSPVISSSFSCSSSSTPFFINHQQPHVLPSSNEVKDDPMGEYHQAKQITFSNKLPNVNITPRSKETSVALSSSDFTNHQQPRFPPSGRHEVVNKHNLNFTANVYQNEQFLRKQHSPMVLPSSSTPFFSNHKQPHVLPSSNEVNYGPTVINQSKLPSTQSNKLSIIKETPQSRDEISAFQSDISEQKGSNIKNISSEVVKPPTKMLCKGMLHEPTSLDLTKMLKNCWVHLIRCDSEFFKLPPGVKRCSDDLQSFISDDKSDEINFTTKRIRFHSGISLSEEEENLSTSVAVPNRVTPENTIKQSVTAAEPTDCEEKSSKPEKMDCEEHKNDNSGYSQVEEVITISDDDDYFDFSSSQVIKQEPLDEDDELFSYEREIFGNGSDSSELLAASTNKNDSPLVNVCDGMALIESVDNVRKFVQLTDKTYTSIKEPEIDVCDYFPMSQLSCYNDERSSSNDSCISRPHNDKSEMSKLSIVCENSNKFQSVDKGSESDSSASSHDYVMTPTSMKKMTSKKPAPSKPRPEMNHSKHQNTKKTTRKGVVLITPKPMEHRPRYRRGREEWFEEKQVNRDQLSPEAPVSKALPKKRQSKSDKTRIKKSPVKSSLKDYRIPKKSKPIQPVKNKASPGGSPSVLPIVETKNTKESYGPKKNIPTIARRPGKPSRSAFLTSDLQKTHMVRRPSSTNSTNKVAKLGNKEPLFSKNVSNTIDPSAHRTYLVPPKPILRNKLIPDVTNMLNKTANCHVPSSKDHTNIRRVHFETPYQSNVGLSIRDPRLNRPGSSHVFPAGDKFLNDTMEENYISSSATSFLSKYSSNPPNKFPAISYGSSVAEHQNLGNCGTSLIHNKANNQNRFSKVNSTFLIKKVVELNTSWLGEQKKQPGKPPSAVSKGAQLIPLYFNNLDHYVDAFTPMLLLEIWEIIFDASKPILEDRKRHTQKFYFVVHSSEYKLKMIEYCCQAIVNELSFDPVEGNLVILDIMEENKRLHPMFGYVTSHQFEQFDRSILSTKGWKELDRKWYQNARLCKFKVLTKERSINPLLCHLMRGNGICSIRNKLRLADAFQNLADSPLCENILLPKEKAFFVSRLSVNPKREYNLHQAVAIESIAAEIRKPSMNPNIILLQGPPGTGKTHTVIGLLERLTFCHGPKMKILLAAPSNAAIDELGHRLIELNERSNGRTPVKFVRVGIPNQISDKMKPFTLDEKATKIHKENFINETKLKESEISNIQSEINSLEKLKSDFHAQQKIIHLKEQIKVLMNHKNAKPPDYVLRNVKFKILRDSDIVLSTLGSCNQSILTATFKPRAAFSFSCCIVDEATQCTEIDILQAMIFGMSKLILVGDHQQLPATVNSKLATNYGYERSMFERFHMFFMKNKKSPILMLTEQFRMHSEICRFPSKYFYQNQLVSSPSNDLKYATFPVKPYVVYDILDGQECNSSSSKSNNNEALVIVNICTQLLGLNSSITIGIITPYQAQRLLYTKALGNNPNYRNIEVNTVDGFQGREKDVIIVSCVRANGNGGIGFLSCKKRLNVAITRARQSLIVCAHVATLRQNSDWLALISDARDRNLFHSVTSYKDIPILFTSMRKN